MYKLIIRPFLFCFQPERAHHLSFSILKVLFMIPGLKCLASKFYSYSDSKLSSVVAGLNFANPVGLAAGFDKNAELLHLLPAFGFGFIEIGTVTPLPQSGNDKPRLFRLKEDQALINRMGFNNDGADIVVERLKKRPKNLIVGGNIGKNKITPNENAVNDYIVCFNKLFDYVDYFVVNVSSPNTPDLRALQDKGPLTEILSALMNINNSKESQKPIFLKIAPDLNEDQLLDIVDIVKETKIAGLIATNTTISRSNLKMDSSKIEAIGAGGLSGAPVKNRSTSVIEFLSTKSRGEFPIIGVGGIQSANDAIEKMNAGASLVQVYTGFIYEGPAMVKKILKALPRK
jgi:dihydroorotate dehydrogenase